MKTAIRQTILRRNEGATTGGHHPKPGYARSQDGTAVIVVLAFLALLLIYITANIRTLYSLGRELKLLEQKQTRRLEFSSRTNAFLIATNFNTALNAAPQQLQVQAPSRESQ